MNLYSLFIKGGPHDALAAIERRLPVRFNLFQTVTEGTPLDPTTRVLIGPWMGDTLDHDTIHAAIVAWMMESRDYARSAGSLVFYSIMPGIERGSYRIEDELQPVENACA